MKVFRGYPSYHSWTSATVLSNQALIVTKKVTTIVTLAELEILTRHLGITLQVEPERNGRLWVYKNNDTTIMSNKDFGDLSNLINTTVCQVQKDILTLHTQLKTLLTYAQKIHKDFLDIQEFYPALGILDNTCFMGKTFDELMKLSLIVLKNCILNQSKAKRSIISALLGDNDKINALSNNMYKAMQIQDLNFNKIIEMDKSLVHNLNALLKNEESHDADIRSLYQIIKSLGHHFDQVHHRAIAYNIRTNFGHSIMSEMQSLDEELKILKDAIHNLPTPCSFSECVVSRHLHKKTNDQLILTEHVQKFRLDKNFLILCEPANEHKISSYHNQVAHKINNKDLILSTGARIQLETLSNASTANEHLQFITQEMLLFDSFPR